MSGCKVGYSGSMQRERCAQEGGNPAFDYSKITKPDRMQFKRNLAGRGAFRLLPGTVAVSIKPQELRRNEVIDSNQLQEIMRETGAVIASPQSLPQGVPQVITPPVGTSPLRPDVNSTGSERIG